MIEFKHLEEALAQYADAIADRYKANLESSGRRASGNFIDKIKTKVSHNGNEFSIELKLEPYWKWIEEGRPPTRSMSPSKPTLQECILDWIKVKNIMPTEYNDKLPIEKQLENMSYAIPNKIHREGYKGTYDLEHTLNEVDYEQIIAEAFNMDVMDYINEILLILQ